MRSLIMSLLASLALVPATADDATAKAQRRKSTPIAGGWLLTAGQHEKARTDGERTLLLVATGTPELKRTTKLFGGSHDVTATAGRIEVDFERKKIILRDTPRLTRLDPKTKQPVSTTSGEAGTVIELDLKSDAALSSMTVTGAFKTSPDPENRL